MNNQSVNSMLALPFAWRRMKDKRTKCSALVDSIGVKYWGSTCQISHECLYCASALVLRLLTSIRPAGSLDPWFLRCWLPKPAVRKALADEIVYHQPTPARRFGHHCSSFQRSQGVRNMRASELRIEGGGCNGHQGGHASVEGGGVMPSRCMAAALRFRANRRYRLARGSGMRRG